MNLCKRICQRLTARFKQQQPSRKHVEQKHCRIGALSSHAVMKILAIIVVSLAVGTRAAGTDDQQAQASVAFQIAQIFENGNDTCRQTFSCCHGSPATWFLFISCLVFSLIVFILVFTFAGYKGVASTVVQFSARGYFLYSALVLSQLISNSLSKIFKPIILAEEASYGEEIKGEIKKAKALIISMTSALATSTVGRLALFVLSVNVGQVADPRQNGLVFLILASAFSDTSMVELLDVDPFTTRGLTAASLISAQQGMEDLRNGGSPSSVADEGQVIVQGQNPMCAPGQPRIGFGFFESMYGQWKHGARSNQDVEREFGSVWLALFKMWRQWGLDAIYSWLKMEELNMMEGMADDVPVPIIQGPPAVVLPLRAPMSVVRRTFHLWRTRALPDEEVVGSYGEVWLVLFQLLESQGLSRAMREALSEHVEWDVHSLGQLELDVDTLPLPGAGQEAATGVRDTVPEPDEEPAGEPEGEPAEEPEGEEPEHCAARVEVDWDEICGEEATHKRLPPIGHAAPRAHVKAEALPGWKWIGTKFVVKKQPLWKKAVQFASTNASGLLQTAVWSLLTVWFASWLRPRMIMTATASAAGGRLRQGIGKSTMLRKAFSKLWKRGWWRASKLLATVLRQPDKDKPSQEIWLLTTLNELCKACTAGPVITYLQLTTKNRSDQFSDDECDAIASTVGACARRLTYDNALCKFIEVSVSLIADKIQDKFNMSELLVVQPLPFAEFVKVMKTDKMLSGRLEQVVGKDAGQIEEVLKYYYLRAGGNFRDLALLLRNVAVAGIKGAAAVKTQIEEWYRDRTKPIRQITATLDKTGKPKYKDFLKKVAQAGPMGYLCENQCETDLGAELRASSRVDGSLWQHVKAFAPNYHVRELLDSTPRMLERHYTFYNLWVRMQNAGASQVFAADCYFGVVAMLLNALPAIEFEHGLDLAQEVFLSAVDMLERNNNTEAANWTIPREPLERQFPLFLGLQANDCAGAKFRVYVYESQQYSLGSVFCSAGQWGVEVLLHRFFASGSCRTLNADEADLFLVPDYRACHIHLAPNYQHKGLTLLEGDDYHSQVIRNHRDKYRRPEEAESSFLGLIQTLPYFDRKKGMDHIFIFSDQGFIVNFTHTFPSWRDHIPHSIFLTTEAFTPGCGPGCFSPWKDAVIPGHIDLDRMERIRSFNQPSSNRSLLFNFHGRLPVNHDYYEKVGVRRALLQFAELPDVSVGGFIEEYFEVMGRAPSLGKSHFCLVPEGTSSWTNHLYESFFAGCIPLILSDRYVLPFQDLIDWPSISIRWPQEAVSLEMYMYVKELVGKRRPLVEAIKQRVDEHACWFDFYRFDRDCSPYPCRSTYIHTTGCSRLCGLYIKPGARDGLPNDSSISHLAGQTRQHCGTSLRRPRAAEELSPAGQRVQMSGFWLCPRVLHAWRPRGTVARARAFRAKKRLLKRWISEAWW
eukprot:s372_g8.t6